ncbi:MAG: pyridoxal 5'-phosphate synthase glutaminase subunit PdxT [Bryobacterales bacterium]|nr:pyridoxal 5'-phosphate synthase glutaminase subunit PdxT [Bryobacterales bacterium]
MPEIGVLALQGDYEAHIEKLGRIGATAREIRTADELAAVDALVIPGGESTTMLRILHRENLWDTLVRFGLEKPIFGTCAGAILMASEVTGPEQESFGFLDIAVVRNAYGRQLDSRIVTLEPENAAKPQLGEAMEAVFIRAPVISRTGPAVETLVRYQGNPVLVRQGKHLAATFHPELTDDTHIHDYFVKSLTNGGTAGH